ncbi:M20/M25/M40 family metallo-hydrolase [Hymenobacter sp. BT770]|uniref:M20/M25/M40 family metallo-hydrolase n=1 Tax=Hymenobacter sp. BT770 TaxID=2886942 RepID=UPI001D120B21|nr:M20/M25/M40 family metallo-hydrolase [Hymenobacter sp. BT770]MCC3152495.1 M20/M25/M40 family metallo-hydrolase [Hymenobacter sp. BT770]MDO3414529.1 M20/M25/M40 family metallo-hydrolase [Hymenobacter sp. BT770]
MTHFNSAAWCRRTALAAAAVLTGLAPAHAQRGAKAAKAKPEKPAAAVAAVPVSDSVALRRIFDEALLRGESYDNLRYLTGTIGARLSGSPQAQQAVEWGKATMEKAGFDRVYLQEVMVPHWVRGSKEKGEIVGNKGKEIKVPVCALGGSVGTGGKLKAGVVEVHSFDELKKLPDAAVKGKFIFYNRPFDDALIEPGTAYGRAGDQRRSGAIEAAKRGAVGALVRSLTSARDDNPHTGTMAYDEAVTKVPGAALSTNAADQLSLLLKANPELQFELEMECATLPEVKSYNVVGEIKGNKFPQEIITVGGHLDSWDLAQGAHDDGTGCVQSMEALRLLRAAGFRPERTVRAVLFMNEENGARGGKEYARLAAQNKETHVAAIESDGGGFTPRGFNLEADAATLAKVAKWAPLLKPYNADDITAGHGGTDIEPLQEAVHPKALIGYKCDSQRYFDIHHTAADTFDKVNRRELELGGASMASLIYLLSKYGL